MVEPSLKQAGEKKNEGGEKMNTIAKTLAGVERERERERERVTILEDKTSIFPYALLKLHARDG